MTKSTRRRSTRRQSPPRQIAVVGGSDVAPKVLDSAERVGAAVAEARAILVCGGLAGVMEAACRGAQGAGGVTLGILPGRDRAAGNPYLTCSIATGLGDFRNYLVVATADAVIALDGRCGTLSEIAMALTLGKPVVTLGAWTIEGVIDASTPEEAVAFALAQAARPRSPRPL